MSRTFPGRTQKHKLVMHCPLMIPALFCLLTQLPSMVRVENDSCCVRESEFVETVQQSAHLHPHASK